LCLFDQRRSMLLTRSSSRVGSGRRRAHRLRDDLRAARSPSAQMSPPAATLYSINPTAQPTGGVGPATPRRWPERRPCRSRPPGRSERERQSSRRSISTAAHVTAPTATSEVIASRKSITLAPVDAIRCFLPSSRPLPTRVDARHLRVLGAREIATTQRLIRATSGKVSTNRGQVASGSTSEERGSR
jgi:hypothetical protein